MIVIPIRTVPGMNAREHPMARHRRVKTEREMTAWGLAVAYGGARNFKPRPTPPLVVLLMRFGPCNPLDDNLPGALKAVRDAVAEWLGVDDRHADLVRYEYDQRRAIEWGVGIEFKALA